MANEAAKQTEAKAAADAVTEMKPGMGWYPGGTNVASPLDATTGVHAEGNPAESRPASVTVAVLAADNSAAIRIMHGGAPSIPVGVLHIPQAMIADLVAALQATPA